MITAVDTNIPVDILEPDLLQTPDHLSLSRRSGCERSEFPDKKLKRTRAMAQEIFERHCGRVRYDLIRRTEETTRTFRKSLNEKIDLTLGATRDALNRAVALKNQGEVEVSRTVSQLSQRLSAVEEIKAALHGYRREREFR